MHTRMRALLLAAVAVATQPFLSASTAPRSLWLTFVDGATRDINGEWSTGGHVTVLRHATADASEMIYRDVVYRSVWRGVDARVSAAEKGLRYSFEVAPGADPRAIHLRYSGHDSIQLSDTGEIVLDAGGSTIVDTRPVAYQQISGRTVNVPVRFVQFEADVAFSLGDYDKTKPLTIDLKVSVPSRRAP